MLVRRIARPLLAAWFVSEGVEALRRPRPHVVRAEAAWDRVSSSRRLAGRVDVPPPPPSGRLRTLVRVHGVAMTLLGLHLAFGKHPRSAALGLAALTVPLAAVNQPLLGVTGDKSELRERFVRNLSMIGGALIAGIDLEGRPGVAWRAGHALTEGAAARETRAATAAAARQSRAALREARRRVG